MKRMLLLLLILLCLAGCGAPEGPETQENFTFTYSGVEITLHGDAAPVLAALGEPKSYTEEASCAFEGLPLAILKSKPKPFFSSYAVISSLRSFNSSSFDN